MHVCMHICIPNYTQIVVISLLHVILMWNGKMHHNSSTGLLCCHLQRQWSVGAVVWWEKNKTVIIWIFPLERVPCSRVFKNVIILLLFWEFEWSKQMLSFLLLLGLFNCWILFLSFASSLRLCIQYVVLTLITTNSHTQGFILANLVELQFPGTRVSLLCW